MAAEAGGYRLHPLAEADLEDIWDHTARVWSPDQAARYHAKIVETFEGLARGSGAGRPCDVRDGYFKYGVGSHVVFYRAAGKGIHIVRVLHRRMDAGRHL